MARPRTALGSYGKVTVVGHVMGDRGRPIKAPEGVKPTQWRARTKIRDEDGKLRDVEAWASTKAKAEVRLKAALVQRQTPAAATGLRPDTTLVEAGEFWLVQIERPGGRLSANTVEQYRGTFERHVKGSGIAHLTLREVNRVAVLERYLQAVAEGHGRGSAKTVRSVVASILSLAVRYEVLDGNRMRDTQMPVVHVPETVRQADRAFTVSELRTVLGVADQNATVAHMDLADLVHFMAGSGARISEALSIQWQDVALAGDDDEQLLNGEAHIRGTKTLRSDRVVPLPDWVTDRLRERADRFGTTGLVFPSPGTTNRGKPRDRRNVTRGIRVLLDDAGFPWATSHTFRTTVGDMVTKSLHGTAASNVLGHSRTSMTYDRYSDRRQRADGAALALSGLLAAEKSGG